MKKSFISQYNFFPEIKTDIFRKNSNRNIIIYDQLFILLMIQNLIYLEFFNVYYEAINIYIFSSIEFQEFKILLNF